MSRTPETIEIKSAIAARNCVVGCGCLAGFIAFGSFMHGDLVGQGLVFTAIAGGLFYVASKIKVRKVKVFEGGIYK